MAIPKRILGKTGIEVTALGLGGVCWNLLDEDKDAVAVVLRAIDRGIIIWIRRAVISRASGDWDWR